MISPTVYSALDSERFQRKSLDGRFRQSWLDGRRVKVTKRRLGRSDVVHVEF